MRGTNLAIWHGKAFLAAGTVPAHVMEGGSTGETGARRRRGQQGLNPRGARGAVKGLGPCSQPSENCSSKEVACQVFSFQSFAGSGGGRRGCTRTPLVLVSAGHQFGGSYNCPV